MSSANTVRSRKNTAARNTASSATAVSVRTASKRLAAADCRERWLQFGRLRVLQLLAGAPEAPLALAVPVDRLVECHGIEVRPQAVGEKELRVGELPKEKIADALLAAGADEQIRLGRIRHREIRREVLFR